METNDPLAPIPLVWTDAPLDVSRELRENHPLHYVEDRDLFVLSRY